MASVITSYIITIVSTACMPCSHVRDVQHKVETVSLIVRSIRHIETLKLNNSYREPRRQS